MICFDEHKMKLEKLSIFTYKDLLKTSTNFYKKKSDYNSKVNKNSSNCGRRGHFSTNYYAKKTYKY